MLLDVLRTFSDIVESYDVTAMDGSGPHMRIRLLVRLRDQSVLHVRQVILDGTTLKYAYHWETHDRKVISRWDNAPHFRTLATFPHHRHLDNPDVVEPSAAGGDLSIILQIIRTMIKNKISE